MKHKKLNDCNGKTIKEIDAYETRPDQYRSLMILFEDGDTCRIGPFKTGGTLFYSANVRPNSFPWEDIFAH
ncbi:MAG: hypothetical protein WC390_06685 [Sulfurimonas sp.]|jgi:hypothetical protein